MILTPARVAELKSLIQTDSDAAAFYRGTLLQGEYLLTQKPIGPGRDNAPARPYLQRIYTLGLLYQLTGNATWAERTRAELMNTVKWQQWGERPIDL